jgi:flagellar protein FliS
MKFYFFCASPNRLRPKFPKAGAGAVDNQGSQSKLIHKDATMATTYQQRQNAYRQTQIHTASKEQLVLMLYDGVLRFSEQGREAIAEKNYEKKQFALVRSQDIIFELVNGLDHEKGGEIAANLARLYAYAIKRLVDANLKNDAAGIDEAQDIFRNLREAWSGAMAKVAKERADEAPSPIEHTPAPLSVNTAPRIHEFASAGAGLGGLALSV